LADGTAVVLAEVGNRLVIGNKQARQPHHLNIAPSLTLEPPARLNPVHAERRGLHHVLIEIRQDLIAGENGQRNWAARLARLLPQSHLAL
jgi:hypothetical protein